eukprot:15222406-Alexandrium_andersonii.AAC.1
MSPKVRSPAEPTSPLRPRPLAAEFATPSPGPSASTSTAKPRQGVIPVSLTPWDVGTPFPPVQASPDATLS